MSAWPLGNIPIRSNHYLCPSGASPLSPSQIRHCSGYRLCGRNTPYSLIFTSAADLQCFTLFRAYIECLWFSEIRKKLFLLVTITFSRSNQMQRQCFSVELNMKSKGAPSPSTQFGGLRHFLKFNVEICAFSPYNGTDGVFLLPVLILTHGLLCGPMSHQSIPNFGKIWQHMAQLL